MASLFFYGTLCHGPLLCEVLQDEDAAKRTAPAQLRDHVVNWVEGESFPMIASQRGEVAKGLVLRDVTAEEEARLLYYSGAIGCRPVSVEVETTGGSGVATCFFPKADLAPAAPWVLEAWVERWGGIAVAAARDVMRRRDQVTAEDAAVQMPFHMARAWARELARTPAPTTLRYAPKPGDVEVLSCEKGFRGFFELEKFTFTHRLFDGGQSAPILRESFVAFDAALVLPYDPKSDLILLIEQLRFGPIWRNDPVAWVLEPIAGLVDAGEAPADTARREAVEEAGLVLGDLIPMTKVCASPGYSTEFFHCYLGVTSLDGHSSDARGLPSENEDIRSHVVTFDEAMALVETGEINAGPLVMMLYWLAAHRGELMRTA